MHTAKQVRDDIVKRIKASYDLTEAKSISEILLEDCFGVTKEDILLDQVIELDHELLEEYAERLSNNEPIQYVTGCAYFLGRKYKISREVLIPRPETEELVMKIVEDNDLKSPNMLDVGTGSGCIAISLNLALGGKGQAIDVSEKALEIAAINNEAMGGSVEFLKQDILTSIPPFENLDILVSNPPYIPNSDKSIMHSNVLAFEPETALFVQDSNPLIFYDRISAFGRNLLKEGGKLYFELHEKYAQEVKTLVERHSYREVQIHQDMQGKDRMLSAINSTSKLP